MKSNLDLNASNKSLLALRHLVRQLPTPSALLDNDLNFVAVSDAWADFFQKESKKLELSPVSETFMEITTDNKNSFVEFFKNLEKKKQRFQLQNKWVEVTLKPWFDEEENQVGFLISLLDDTEKVELKNKNKKLNLLLEETSAISKIGMWEFNLVTNKLSWSKMTKKMHEVPKNYTPSIDTAIDFYKEGHSRNTVSMLFQNALNKGESFEEILQIVTEKGKELWVRSAGKPVYKKGKLAKIIGTFQDIDEQVRAEMKIRENEKLLESIIDNLPLNVYVKDKESKKILINKAECEYLGVKNKKELIGKSDFDIYDKEIAQISRNEDMMVMKTQRPIIARETINVKKCGSETTFLTSKIPLIDIHGNAIGIIGISLDITKLKRKEAELKNLINITSLQNKKLLNFAHIVSHNLRSHSANFSMLLNFLAKEKDKVEKQKIMKMLVNASDNLMITLEDLNKIIDISTKVNLDKQELDLNEKLTKVKEDLITYLNDNSVKIINKIPKNTKVLAVHAYLESVILNLITNAIKYQHPERFPEIKLSIEKNKKQTVLIVEDNGIGIDLKKNGNKLFGMYKTFHSNKDARGMGLYITKNQMEAMGGDITVESTVGKGTTFKVYFNEN